MTQFSYREVAFQALKRLMQDTTLNRYFTSTEDLLSLLKIEENQFATFSKSSETEIAEHFYSIGVKFYKTYNLPVEDTASIVDFLVQEFILASKRDYIDISPQKIFKIAEICTQSVCKAYFYETLDEIIGLMNSKGENKSPISMHFSWLKSLSSYLKNPDTKQPEMDFLSCHFGHWLESMEFELLAFSMGEQKYEYHSKIFVEHRNVHQQAEFIISYIKNGHYQQAYSHLNKLYISLLQIEEAYQVINHKYSLNSQNIFFDYVDYKSTYNQGFYFYVSLAITPQDNAWRSQAVQANAELFKAEMMNLIHQNDFNAVLLCEHNRINMFIDGAKNRNKHSVQDFLENTFTHFIENHFKNKKLAVSSLAFAMDDLEKRRETANKLYFLKHLNQKLTKPGFSFYNKVALNQMQAEAIEEQQLEQQVIKCLDNNDLEIFFQPIIREKHSKRIYVEALVRVFNEKQIVPGYKVVPIIERAERQTDLDYSIFSKIPSMIAELSAVVSELSININPGSFESSDMIKKVVELNQLCTQHQIRLIVEITEQAFLSGYDKIEDLSHNHDIHFAIDDFGSGYSNMIQLIELAEARVIQVLKIDGTLIKGIDKDVTRFEVIKMLIKIAHTLNLKPVILEFIETEAEVNALNRISEDTLYQGFYFDQALPLKQLIKKYGTGNPNTQDSKP